MNVATKYIHLCRETYTSYLVDLKCLIHTHVTEGGVDETNGSPCLSTAVADAVGWKVLVFTISYSPHDVEVTVDANLLPYCSTSFNNLEIGKS